MRMLWLLAPVSISLIACQETTAEDLKVPPGAHVVHRKGISLERQKALLSSSAPGNPIGTFDSFCSLLYALRDVAIHTHDGPVNSTELSPVFPKFYHPTFAQIFETIARQTRSTMHYDQAEDFWVFDPPAMPLPYSLETPQGWRVEDIGLFVKYVPPSQPVGMDVYMLGTYSTANDPSLANKIRDALAEQFAGGLDPQATAAKMKPIRVADVEALYFECPAPRPGITWRQWSLIDHGQAILVVSTLAKENEVTLLPQVERMVASLKIKGAEAR